MEHAIKTTLGTYRIVKNDSTTTHVVLLNAEFHDIIEISRMFESDIQQLTSESVKLHRKISDDAGLISSLQSKLASVEKKAKELSLQKDDLEQSISVLKEDLSRVKDDLAHEEALNINLKRICRERANQARGLSKIDDGYIVLISQEWREKAQNGQLIRGYKTSIQSPHDASMDDETAKRQIFHDLINDVLADLGCLYYETVNGRPAEPIKETSMYRWIYTADYKSGLWTITIYTTGSLTVPPHRRPQTKQRNQGATNDKSKSRSDAKKGAETGNRHRS